MKRILIDYKKMDHKVAAALIDSYPHGYGDDDLLTIKKPNGEIIEAVEVRTDDTIYLVKIESKKRKINLLKSNKTIQISNFILQDRFNLIRSKVQSSFLTYFIRLIEKK